MNTNKISTKRKEFDSSTEQLNSLRIANSKPPIFTNFEFLKEDSNGFFIINPKDKSIFKWIDVESLECNGRFYPSKELTKGGRRNWAGSVFNDFRDYENSKHRGYYETDDLEYRKCIKKFGGFYCAISRASLDGYSREVDFGTKGILPLINSEEAKIEAQKYAKDYAENQEFISCLPCGAAMDCVFEEIYERFEKEVKFVQGHGELSEDAWNRYNSETYQKHKKEGLYGIHDLLSGGGEFTTEVYNSSLTVAVRCEDSRGLLLISDYPSENLRNFSCSLGNRNFTSPTARFINYGYRIILLPQPQMLQRI